MLAMLIGQVIAPGSKLAIARGLRAQTATSTLGAVLGVSGADEDDLYAAMDWVLARKDGIETDLAARNWPTAPWCSTTCPRRRLRATTCPLGALGRARDGVKGRRQIVYGLLCSPRERRWPSRCSRATPPTRKP